MTADGRRTDDGTRVLRIGTRGSTLATTQTGTVRDALERAGHRAELHIVHTPGDASQAAQTPVTRIGVGVFTETLRTALAAGECDVAVHSFKDLPTAPDDRFVQVVPARADVRDVLVAAGGRGLRDLPAGASVGTGAPRRVSQLRAARPDLGIIPIRGNIDTRMGRVGDGPDDLAGVILARAGLERVGRLDRVTETLDPTVLMPAPAQGALCVEVRADDAAAVAAVAVFDDPVSHAGAVAEREILATLEAGCTAPVAAWSEIRATGTGPEGGAARDIPDGRRDLPPGRDLPPALTLTVHGGVFALDGSHGITRTVTADIDLRPGADWRGTARETGRAVGRRLLDAGAATIVAGSE